MIRFGYFSIKKKLIWISMIVSASVMLLSSIAFVVYEGIIFRDTMVRELTIFADIIGINSASSLIFNDPVSAKATLNPLKTKPSIISAGIYGRNGQIFAEYNKNNNINSPHAPQNLRDRTDGYRFDGDCLVLFKRITSEGEQIGMVYIQSDLSEMESRLIQYAGIVMSVLILALLMAFLISSKLQQMISQPILHLAATAKSISDEKDYTVRATTESHDELGTLVDGFNEMLTQIQLRDSELQKARDGLEIQVKERTKDLQQEISIRKMTEVALRDSEDKWRRLFEEALDAIFVADNITGELIDCNYAATILTGRSKEELIGQHQCSLHPQIETGEQFSETFTKHRSAAEGKILEAQVITKDGIIKDVEIRASIINLGGRKVLQGAFRDISERKIAEKKLGYAMEELARSNAELQQFAYVASHDLQEPLRMVASFSQLLGNRYRDHLGQDADEFIGFIVDGANRMQRLINDLLSYSRVGTRGKPFQLIDFSVILGQVLVNLGPLIEENGAIITNGDLPVLMADETQISQLFQNLISNAIKFRSAERPVIHITARKEPDEWVFSVCDNGIGISPEYHERIFVIFQRLHAREEYQGTGIGLAICKRIVERHGGRIWVESEQGKGSKFFFTISLQGGNV
jgi:PAS domain S-box-containing protein